MSVFNLDENIIMDTIASALEEAGSQVSETQFEKITEAIDEALPGVIEVLTYEMQEHWKQEARDSGTEWGEKYANAIEAKVSEGKGEVYLDEDMVDKTSNKPNMMYVKMIEEGMKSFSIKDALLASDKAKTGADGVKYITVPMPVGIPRSKSQGKQASKFGGREMTQEMYNIVKSGGRVSGKLKSGQKVSGLTRYVTRQRHSQYGIFLRVSEKSTGWIHPGRGATPVFPSVIMEVNKRVGQILSDFCKAIVSEFT